MSGLLQRLAGQAMATQTSGAPRIRPAMSVHAQVPLALPRDGDVVQPTPVFIANDPRPQSEIFGARNPEQREPAKENTPGAQSAEADEPASRTRQARSVETQLLPAPTLRETPTRRAVQDFIKTAPHPLLDMVDAVSPAAAITPAIQPVAALPVALKSSQTEPTEIHVHIGRIDVIAASEPPAPKKNRATPARNSLPLADYLARRRRS
jgi:hypothetical protein